MSSNTPGRPPHPHASILAAAKEVLLEHGLDVSLETIAQRAKTTRQTLYNHFSSKNALLMEVFDSIKSELEAPLLAIKADSFSFEEFLPDFCDRLQAHFFDRDVLRFQRFLILAQVQMPDILSELRARRSGGIRKFFTKILIEENKRGNIRVDAPEEAAQSFLGAILGPAHLTALLGGEMPSIEARQRLKQEVCESYLYLWKYRPSGSSNAEGIRAGT